MDTEFDLIRLIAERAGPPGPGTPVGIGDDAAVLELAPGDQLVACVDTMNAGVHFFPDTDPTRLGHKALAVNLSDMAAMGARPRWALLSLSLPDSDIEWLRRFVDGLLGLANCHGVRLVGGDTCRGPLAVTVTVLGSVASGRALLRSTARPGDLVVVSGKLGAAGYALGRLARKASVPESALDALERPMPRIALGAALAGRATSCIDLSDGLLADLGHVASASGCGAEIDLDALPLPKCMQGLDPEVRWNLQTGSGDDYELCFTWPAERVEEIASLAEVTNASLSVVGRMVAGTGVRCVKPDGNIYRPSRTGHEHFNE